MLSWLFMWVLLGFIVRGIIHTVYPNLITHNLKEFAFEIFAWPYLAYIFFFSDWDKL